MVRHGSAGDAVSLPYDDGRPGNGGVIDAVHGLDAAADGGGAFRFKPDHEARIVDEMHDRQAELIRKRDEALGLFRRVRRP